MQLALRNRIYVKPWFKLTLVLTSLTCLFLDWWNGNGLANLWASIPFQESHLKFPKRCATFYRQLLLTRSRPSHLMTWPPLQVHNLCIEWNVVIRNAWFNGYFLLNQCFQSKHGKSITIVPCLKNSFVLPSAINWTQRPVPTTNQWASTKKKTIRLMLPTFKNISCFVAISIALNLLTKKCFKNFLSVFYKVLPRILLLENITWVFASRQYCQVIIINSFHNVLQRRKYGSDINVTFV